MMDMMTAARWGIILLLPACYSWAAPTYSHDVRPILESRCAGCHRAGDIGPMSLRTYMEVRPWARAIRQAVLTHTMPPWGAEPNPKHPFRNDRSLSPQELQTLVQWVDAGAPEGDKSLAIAQQVSGASTAGEQAAPDLVIRIPGFEVPSSGLLPYSFLIVPLHLDHDTWIREAEFHIDQRQVIHHINAFVRPANSSFLRDGPENKICVASAAQRAAKREGEKVFDRRELLLGYEPGYRPGPWINDGGKLVRAGSDIVFELHYNPNGKAVTDHSELRLYFSHEKPARRVLAIDTLRDLDLQIPPGDADYRSYAEMTLARPVQLLSVQPHMHYRGKSMEVRAVYPDGRSETLVRVPRYDFNWQTTYSYRDPVDLPAGTKLESTAVFDNSAGNKFNPDPSATVHWGDQTIDEMHIAFLELIVPSDSDVDTLFRTPPRLWGQPRTSTR